MRQDFEILALELKLSKTNWLTIGTYKPPSPTCESIKDHELSVLISYSTCFENINPTCIDNFLRSKKNSFYEYSDI